MNLRQFVLIALLVPLLVIPVYVNAQVPTDKVPDSIDLPVNFIEKKIMIEVVFGNYGNFSIDEFEADMESIIEQKTKERFKGFGNLDYDASWRTSGMTFGLDPTITTMVNENQINKFNQTYNILLGEQRLLLKEYFESKGIHEFSWKIHYTWGTLDWKN